jgi:hypothetical protein
MAEDRRFSPDRPGQLWPKKPPIQWVPERLFVRVKRPGREADDSPVSSAEVTNAWSYTTNSQHSFMECTGTNFR